MQAILIKLIFNAILKKLESKFGSMKAISDYTFKSNNLDKSFRKLKKEIADLKENSHPPMFTKKSYKDILKRLDKLERLNESK